MGAEETVLGVHAEVFKGRRGFEMQILCHVSIFSIHTVRRYKKYNGFRYCAYLVLRYKLIYFSITIVI